MFHRLIAARGTSARRHRSISKIRRLFFEPLEDRRLMAVTISEFPAAPLSSNPIGITVGADGNLWFTEHSQTKEDPQTKVKVDINKIGKITPAGVTQEYDVPTGDIQPPVTKTSPYAIARGADGNLWFTEEVGNIVKFNPTTSQFTRYFGAGDSTSIAALPDGTLWFVDFNFNSIGKITSSGDITKYPIPTDFSIPYGITAGPDGNLWFTEQFGNKIGRITPAGVITDYQLPSSFGQPKYITTGPDGCLWFTEEGSNSIGRITPAGKIDGTVTITEFPIDSSGQNLNGIATGPDHNLWFTESPNGSIVQFNPASGVFTHFAVPTSSHYPGSITAGPDGNMWFTEDQVLGLQGDELVHAGYIGRVNIPANPLPSTDVEITGEVLPGQLKEGIPFSYRMTVTNKGSQTAKNVIVYDPIPTSVSYNEAKGDGFVISKGTISVTGGQSIAKLGDLAPGATATITLRITPRAGGQIVNRAYVVSDSPDPVQANNEVVVSATVQPRTTSLLLGGALVGDATGNPMKYHPINGGTTGKFAWQLARTGGDDATEVGASIQVPATLADIAPYVDSPGTFTVSSNVDGTNKITFSLPDVTGDNTIHFGFTAKPTQTGPVSVTASATAHEQITGGAPSKTINTTVEPATTSLLLGGLLVGDATGNPMKYDQDTGGTTGKLSWQLVRTGGDSATGLKASIQVPANLTGIVPYVDAPGTFSFNGTNLITFNLPDLPDDRADHFGFTAKPTGFGPISVTASVTAAEQINGGAPSKTVNTVVEDDRVALSLNGTLSAHAVKSGASAAFEASLAAADGGVGTSGSVSLMKIDSTNTFIYSGTFAWKLKNDSDKKITGLKATIAVPPTLVNIRPSPDGGVYSDSTHILKFDILPNLLPGETATFGFDAAPTVIGPVWVTADVTMNEKIRDGGSLSKTISTVVVSDLVGHLDYHGGAVVSNAHLVPLYYGDDWQKSTKVGDVDNLSQFPAKMQTAMQSMVSGPYMDFLGQYGTASQIINRGTIEEPIIILAGPAPAFFVDDSVNNDVGKILRERIDAYRNDKKAFPDKDTIYVIYTPPGTVVMNSFGNIDFQDSTKDFLGYHGSYKYTYSTGLRGGTSTKNYRYIVMPWEASPNSSFTRLSTFQNMSRTFSHELAETVTNPDSNAWFDSKRLDEIGDIENSVSLQKEPEGGTSSYGMLDGTLVQYEWANYYQYPGTNFAVVDQPVLPQDAASTTVKVTQIFGRFGDTSGALHVASGFFTSGLVAAFTDKSNVGADPAIYTPTIDWRDGTTSTGTVTYDPNLKQFLISGSHTFASAAGSTVAVVVSLVNNTTGDVASISADVTLNRVTAAAAAVGFDKPTFEAYRNGSDATITVGRTGDTTLESTVDFHVSGGTAVDGTDYQAQAGTLKFAPGVATATILLPVYSNPAATGDLTVNLMLSTPTGNTVLGTQTTTTVTIHPSDQVFAAPAPTLVNDTGKFVNDSLTDGNGSVTAPLVFNVTGASVRNGFLQLVDVTDANNPFVVGNPVQAKDGAAKITLNDRILTDGTHKIAVINAVSADAGARRASQSTQIVIDSVAPTSKVAPLVALQNKTFALAWSGADNAGGSGVDTYDIFVSDNNGPYTPFMEDTTATSATFTGEGGHNYRFYSVLSDIAGGEEGVPATFDTQTTITTHPWFNAPKPFDADNNGKVAPLDALVIINYLNAGLPTSVPPTAATGGGPGFLDTNANDQVAPLDALLVINAINAGLGGEGEGVATAESESAAIEAPDDFAALIALLAGDMAEETIQRRRRS